MKTLLSAGALAALVTLGSLQLRNGQGIARKPIERM